MPIRVLSEDVASAIAAGEVVERPESVVKELVENAIDASAKRIEINIEGGGRRLIEVADDGCGIKADEVPLAVAHHATSKLSTKDDLFQIETLGFRGEALTSIGAVSRMEILTRSTNEEVGTKLTVIGGHIDEPIPIGAPPGTVVRVRDLFFNMPARLKFLKSETTERRRISTLISRYAIAYPQIAFKLVQEGREGLSTTGSGNRTEVLAAVFGLDTAKNMICLPEGGDGKIQVNGYISPPSVHRSNRREITFFVRGRWIQDPSLSAAVLQAYHGLLMVGRYPMAVVLLDMPSEFVDVNVHPTKAEVRFRDPGAIFSVVQRVIRSTLLGQAPAPALEVKPSWWQSDSIPPPSTIDPAWEMDRTAPSYAHPVSVQAGIPGAKVPLLRIVGQVGASYLVAEGPDGLYLIDQHAAHERVLFEEMMKLLDGGVVESQQLLEVRTIEFSEAEALLLEGQLEVLRGLGFDVEPFGARTFRLRSVPAMLSSMDPDMALRAVVEDLEEDEAPLADEIEARVAARICKRAAVKSGQILSIEEQRKLLKDLETCESPRTCPHGRPTMIHLSVESLERQFGRKG